MADKPALKLGILAIDGCMMSSIASPSDALRVASTLARIRDPLGAPRYEAVLVSARGADSVTTATGYRISGLVEPPSDLDVLLVPGVMHASPHDLSERVATLAPEIELLRRMHLRGARIAASCSGTFLLAQSGLLDGRRATTSWWLAAAFRMRFPLVTLEADAMTVEDGDVITSGAATAVLSMVLKLIAHSGPGGETLAQQTSRMLAIDAERQSQAPYVSEALIQRPRNSLSEKAEHFLQKELHHEITVAQLAEHCGTSERSLLRHFKAHYGESPLAHIQHLRVERAKALLEATHLSFDEVVERCGYSDVSSFRKLFKRATSLTPADYRERFRLRAR
jgi:transcriptional regulator GlxA family with amidase domain